MILINERLKGRMRRSLDDICISYPDKFIALFLKQITLIDIKVFKQPQRLFD